MNKKLSSIFICRGSQTITHLLFADGKILYYKVSRMESLKLVNILQNYK